MDTSLDLEQLRNSINEQNIPSAIGQVHQWLDTHGLTLLSSNQRLPLNFEEAEAIRKDHEKIELKCMTFLAFYAKINLKNIPEDYHEMQEEMDIKIQKFSEHIKARRNIVVSFFTLYRHIEKLQEKLFDLQNEDLSNLPDSVEEINSLIEEFNNNITHCLKRLSHLRAEAERVKTALNTIVTLSNSPSFDYIDRTRINESKRHIDNLLKEMEDSVTEIYESQRILALELKIEAKMMLIEDDITRCSGWLQRMEQKLVDRYNAKIVGMATVENDMLCHETKEIVNKMKETKEYCERLMHIFEVFCLQFKRDSSRGQMSKHDFDTLWELGELISTESLNRLTKTSKLFHGLDSTLDKVEDMLLSINKDNESGVYFDEIVQKYRGVRDEAHGELQTLRQYANELFSKLRYDLFNKKIVPTNGIYLEAERTEDMVKMKIFTIAVKLKELDRRIFPEDMSIEPDMIDGHLLGNIDKYLKFLSSTRLDWESKPLPVTLSQAMSALENHQNISGHAEQYWHNIQDALNDNGLQSKNDNYNQQQLLNDAARERKTWNDKWKGHFDNQLNPRYVFLQRLQDFSDEIDKDDASLDDLMNRPNHNLALVKDVKKGLNQMKSKIPKKEKSLNKLYEDALNIHKTDFSSALSIVEDKHIKFRDRLDNFTKLEDMIEEILEFLPQLQQFKKLWPDRVNSDRHNPSKMNHLRQEANEMTSHAASYDIDKLRKLATVSYGNSKRVEWLVDELRAEFLLLDDDLITPTELQGLQKSSWDEVDRPAKEFTVTALVHSEAVLNFDIESLTGSGRDQYNVCWYKNGALLDPRSDQRISTVFEPNKGKVDLIIENCDYKDAGKYCCEVRDTSQFVVASYLINLTISGKKLPSDRVEPLFKDKIHAGRKDPVTLEMKLDGYRFAPDCDMVHNDVSIDVNQRHSPWTRVATNSNIEFSHPAISDTDCGHYDFFIGDKLVAKTEIVIGDAPKLFQHHFKEVVKIGEPASITIPTANIVNKSSQKVIWRKDGQPITPDSGKFNWRIDRNGDPVFEIAQVRASHMGIYTCELTNEYGRTSAQIVLEMDNGVNSNPFKSNPSSDGSTVEELFANVGESVVLAIDYSPSKNSEIIWTKEGKPIAATDPRLKVSNESNNRCILHLNSARITDSGLYTATVKGTNRKHSVNLEIIPPAPGPVIEKYPESVIVKINEPLIIDCLVRSVPSCDDIRWTVRPGDSSSAKQITNSPSCKLTKRDVGSPAENVQNVTLVIDRAKRSDAGEYVLRCENTTGWSSVKIPVTVIDDATNRKKPPTFVQALNRDVKCRGEEPVLLRCKVVGNPFPTVKWTKNGKNVIASDFINIRNSGEVHEMKILNPRAQDSGTYEAIATNSEGTEKCACMLKVVDPEMPTIVRNNESSPMDNVDAVNQSPQRTQLIFSNTIVRSPPQFVTTFTDEIVQEGDDVTLKCCLIGQPAPVVWWSYNTHLLKNPKFEMNHQLDEYSLLMRDVKEEDSGRYSMTAENSSGLATCSALVIVDKNNNKGKSLDRSQYKTNSKPMNSDGRLSPFPCHTTLSQANSPSLADESRMMEASPRGWENNKRSPRPQNK